jgi:hypothetical protein
VGDKPTPNQAEGDKLTPKIIYLWEINIYLTQQREINLQPSTTKTIHMWGINLHPTEGDNLTLKLNQNYLLVGDKPTHIPTER